MNQTKQIDWSYPTSTNAERLGFARTGCWTVSIASGNRVAVAVAGFPTESQAAEHARSLSMPFGRLWQRYETAADTRDNRQTAQAT